MFTDFDLRGAMATGPALFQVDPVAENEVPLHSGHIDAAIFAGMPDGRTGRQNRSQLRDSIGIVSTFFSGQSLPLLVISSGGVIHSDFRIANRPAGVTTSTRTFIASRKIMGGSVTVTLVFCQSSI